MRSNVKTVDSSNLNSNGGEHKARKYQKIPKIPFVRPFPGESPESLVGRFQKAVERCGIIDEIEARMFFEKPSAKRRKRRNNWKRTLEDAKEKNKKFNRS